LFNLAEVSQAEVLKSLNGKSGIYKWTNNLNGKSYVGSSINLHRRIQEYFNPPKISLKAFGLLEIFGIFSHHQSRGGSPS